MKAQYITFEGIDGSGKTNQLALLEKHLKNKNAKVLVTREFGSYHNAACVKLREFSLNSAHGFDELAGQFMFAANSTQHSQKVILPALEQYDYILSDRGVESNIVYCTSIGFDRDIAHTLHSLDYRRVQPDKIVFLDVDPEITWNRLNKRQKETFADGGTDRIEEKGLEFQKKVRQEYLKRIETNPNYVVVSCGDLSIEQTHIKILEKLQL